MDMSKSESVAFIRTSSTIGIAGRLEGKVVWSAGSVAPRTSSCHIYVCCGSRSWPSKPDGLSSSCFSPSGSSSICALSRFWPRSCPLLEVLAPGSASAGAMLETGSASAVALLATAIAEAPASSKLSAAPLCRVKADSPIFSNLGDVPVFASDFLGNVLCFLCVHALGHLRRHVRLSGTRVGKFERGVLAGLRPLGSQAEGGCV